MPWKFHNRAKSALRGMSYRPTTPTARHFVHTEALRQIVCTSTKRERCKTLRPHDPLLHTRLLTQYGNELAAPVESASAELCCDFSVTWLGLVDGVHSADTCCGAKFFDTGNRYSTFGVKHHQGSASVRCFAQRHI
jgi:hypothetical protein